MNILLHRRDFQNNLIALQEVIVLQSYKNTQLNEMLH